MVYVTQSSETRRWGFLMQENQAGAKRILKEEYRFDSPGEVFNWMEMVKSSLASGGFRVEKDRETGVYGYVMANPKTGVVADEEFGWSSSDEVNQFINDLRNAIGEGVTMMPNLFAKAKVMRID